MIRKIHPLAIATGLVLCCGASRPVGQSDSQAQFQSTADVVVMDVSVLDRNRRPVKGLTAADFTILERGAPRDIVAFKEIDIPSASTATAKWMSSAPADVLANRIEDGRLVVILMDDDLNLQVNPFATRSAKESGRAIVQGLGPNDTAAVTFVHCYQSSQEFTADRARLLASVERFQPGSCSSNVRAGTALAGLVRAMAVVPDRRKLVFYVGPGVGLDPTVLAAINLVTVDAPSGELETEGQQRSFSDAMDLFEAAQRANVNIYSINVLGLAPASLADASRPVTEMRYGAAGMPSTAGSVGRAQEDWLSSLARNTGGKGLVYSNAPAKEVGALLGENESYYLLGIRRTTRETSGSRDDRRGLLLHARVANADLKFELRS